MNRRLKNLVLPWLALLLSPIARAADLPSCTAFADLVPAFTHEFSLDPKKVEIKFTPLNLALRPEKDPERRAYLLSHTESCSLTGECDSLLFLRDEKECYRSVLSFRGKWKGLDRKKAIDLASVEIISQVVGDEPEKGSALRIKKVTRHFTFQSAAARYEESK